MGICSYLSSLKERITLRRTNQNKAAVPSLAVSILLSTPGGMYSNGHFGLYPNPPMTLEEFENLKREIDGIMKEYGLE